MLVNEQLERSFLKFSHAPERGEPQVRLTPFSEGYWSALRYGPSLAGGVPQNCGEQEGSPGHGWHQAVF